MPDIFDHLQQLFSLSLKEVSVFFIQCGPLVLGSGKGWTASSLNDKVDQGLLCLLDLLCKVIDLFIFERFFVEIEWLSSVDLRNFQGFFPFLRDFFVLIEDIIEDIQLFLQIFQGHIQGDSFHDH